MNKQKIRVERELESNSQSIIWSLISTAAGLSRWLANEVKQDGDRLSFTWGEVWSHHEIKTAVITKVIKHSCFCYRWENEEDDEAYIELRMEKSDLTDDYILVITDYAEPDEVDTLQDLWRDDLERLHQNTGL